MYDTHTLPALARVAMLAHDECADRRDVAARLYGEKDGEPPNPFRNKHVVELVEKAAVGTATTADFASIATPTMDFARATIEASVLGKLPAVRSVPMRTQLPYLSAVSPPKFIGEGAAFPAVAHASGGFYFPGFKLGAISVYSKELLRGGGPRAEQAIRDSMFDQLVRGIDEPLLDGLAGSTSRPPSLYFGGTSFSGAGVTTPAGLDGLLADLIGALVTGGTNFQRVAFICSHTTALAISLMRNSVGGEQSYPNVGVNGGVVAGLPLVTSAWCPNSVLVAVDASELLLADENELDFTPTDKATIEQDSAPEGAGPTTLMPLFGTDSAALKLTRVIAWRMRRANHVAYVSGLALPLP